MKHCAEVTIRKQVLIHQHGEISKIKHIVKQKEGSHGHPCTSSLNIHRQISQKAWKDLWQSINGSYQLLASPKTGCKCFGLPTSACAFLSAWNSHNSFPPVSPSWSFSLTPSVFSWWTSHFPHRLCCLYHDTGILIICLSDSPSLLWDSWGEKSHHSSFCSRASLGRWIKTISLSVARNKNKEALNPFSQRHPPKPCLCVRS